MNKIKLYLASATVFMLPLVAGAQGGGADAGASASAGGFPADGGTFGLFLGEILKFINDTLIPFIIGIGFLVFVWGMFKFFIMGGANEDKKEEGKSLMVWATLGFVLIIIFWGVVNLIASSTGFDNKALNRIPTSVTL